MQFTRIDDAVFHYQVIGAAPDRPVLAFVNALGTDFRIWRDVVVRLVGRFSILLYDARGHGLSGSGEGAVTIERHADDLAQLLDVIGKGSAIICGLSMGSLVAQQLAHTHPEKVKALILCGALARFGEPEDWDARIASVEANGIEALADTLMEHWFTEGFRVDNPADVAGYRNMVIRQPGAGYIASCAALRDGDLTALSGEVSVPTLCIVGDKDGAVSPSAVANLARAIPGARFELIKNAAHMLPVESPDTMSDIITAFADLAE